jgi:hypothetical protein
MGSAPENGETIADNCIFQLDLDDGIIHWAIVDRSGLKLVTITVSVRNWN